MDRSRSVYFAQRISVAVLATSVMLLLGFSSPAGHAAHPSQSSHPQPNAQQQGLAKQIDALRAQIAQLQAAVDQQRQSPQQPSMQPSPSGMRMGEMDKMQQQGMGSMGKMGAMSKMPQQSGTAAASGCCMGMDMHKGEMGMPPDGMKMPDGAMMNDMGRMSGMSSVTGNSNAASMNSMPNALRSVSSLPGIPGASHLYHIGSTGFFLDQTHITLTAQQQTSLNAIKERALLERTNAERRIAQAEQELWVLTGADQPDATKIQAKLREAEQLRTNQRLSFIQAVGEATKVLTPEQRTQLLGMAGMPSK